MNKKKITLALTLAISICVNTAIPVLAQEQNQGLNSISYEVEDNFEYKYSNIESHMGISNAGQVWNMSELEEGTIVIKFDKPKFESSDIVTLFSLGGTNYPDEHFNLYIKEDKIGLDVRSALNGTYNQSTGTYKIGYTPVVAEAEIKREGNILIVEASKKTIGNGTVYNFYLNGEHILTSSRGNSFISSISENIIVDYAAIGKSIIGGKDKYINDNVIDYVNIYSDKLSNQEISNIMDEVALEERFSYRYRNIETPLDISNAGEVWNMSELKKGTIVVDFDKPIFEAGELGTLFSLGATSYPDEYFNIFVGENKLQIDVRSAVNGTYNQFSGKYSSGYNPVNAEVEFLEEGNVLIIEASRRSIGIGTIYTIYLNGEHILTETRNNEFINTIARNVDVDYAAIGKTVRSAKDENILNGTVNSVTVYNHQLEADQIIDLMN